MGSRLEKKSAAVSKAIQQHDFTDEGGDEYEPSKFGGFPEYFRRKKIKLQNLDAQIRSESSENPSIFRGVVCHVNGYTQPSLNDLHVMIVSHGGGFIQYLDGKTQVTHIIASNLTPKKAVEFKRYRIVKPAWIPDSIQAGRLLPWESYRVLDEGAGQKVLQFDHGKLGSQVNRLQRGYRDQTDTSWYTRNFFQPGQSLPLDNEPKGHGEDCIEDLDEADFSSFDPEKTSSNEMTAVKSTRESENRQCKQTEDQGQDASLGDDSLGQLPSDHEGLLPSDNEAADEDIDPADRQETDDRRQLLERSKAIPPHTYTATSLDQTESNIKLDSHQQRPQQGQTRDSLPQLKRKATHTEHPDIKRAKMTAEEHNAELLSDPRIRKSSVLNPDFLEQYYRESRLHHLSTWKADLKSQLQALTLEKTASQKQRSKRAAHSRRYILHVDFDSFFVAVSLKNFPQFKDTPAVVAHGAGSGSEIASCNYAARAFGVKNGMWMKRAQDLCDHLKVLPYDFPAYEAASRLFYDAILNLGGVVQSVSIDEALVDISTICHSAGGTDGAGVREGSIWREEEKADEIAEGLRSSVKESTGCAVSVGIGGNILLAKVALRRAKPAGQHQIKPEQVLDFIALLKVQDLPGVAYSIGGKLEEIGIKLVRDMREVTKERLVAVLGPKTGEKLYNYARGIDKAEVGDQVVRKSVSAEVNWGVRFETQEQADEFIESLCGELNRRLLKERVKGRNLTMKVMRRAADAPMDPPKHLGHGKCDTYNKSVALGVATSDKEVLAKEALSMLRSWGFSPGELRGLGVQMTKLEPVRRVTEGSDLGNQRRLEFNVPAVPLAANKALTDEAGIEDRHAPESSLTASQRHVQFKAPRKDAAESRPADFDDIQDGPETPRKTKRASNIAQQFIDSPSKKPLNVTGTQFVLPSQVDPTVLSELPREIRDKLMKVAKSAPSQKRLGFEAAERPGQDGAEDRPPFAATALPSESQLDPAILAALPEDVRAEILSQYGKSELAAPQQPSAPAVRAAQSVLPQSPRKNRTARPNAPRGRGRPRGGLMARLKGAAQNGSTLTQANFVAARHNESATESETDANADEPDADFLAALPDDIRSEVVAQHRAAQMRKRTGLEVSRRRGKPGSGGAKGERLVKLDPRPARPTFTTQKLCLIDDLREAIKEWADEFSEDGPYEEDVRALGKYLADVVKRERDMKKAVDLTRWLGWVVDQHDLQPDQNAERKWSRACSAIQETVQSAVESRGLGEVDFG